MLQYLYIKKRNEISKMFNTNEVQVNVINHIGLIKLNRQKALNALSLDMIKKISYYLDLWEEDPSVAAVLIKSKHPTSFCSGGDIKSIYLNNDAYRDEYLANQYLMDYHIHTYSKPVISLLNGIVFGGGVGLGLAASHKVATEHIRLAMPETKIGFFPDVGTTRMLNDLPDYIGRYIALLGVELDVDDVSYLKLTNYSINSNDLKTLEKELFSFHWRIETVYDDLDYLLKKYNNESIGESKIKMMKNEIMRVFSKDSIEEMLLESKDTWIETQLEKQSPTALCITYELLKSTKDKSLYECFKFEHNLSRHVTQTHDFKEGVRSLLVDKDQRFLYQPKEIKEVKTADIEKLFDFSEFEKVHIMDKIKLSPKL